MADFKFADAVVAGKKMSEWLKSDEGLVDYSKCGFGKNVSNKENIGIYDLGEFEYDPGVGETRYCNGVDLARVAGCIEYGEPYYGMSPITALNGDDYVRIFYNSFRDITIKDFVLYFFRILDGDIYVSETNYHVFVKGRFYEEEEWHAAVDELYSRQRKSLKELERKIKEVIKEG